MRVMRFLGWTLLAVAFVAAAAESAAHAITRQTGLMASSDVLRVLAPDFFVRLEAAVRGVLPAAVWDHGILTALALPGWLLFGVPGGLMAWLGRARDGGANPADDDYPHTTYEDIVAAAEEADEWDIGLPSKYRDLEEYDPTRPIDEEAFRADAPDTRRGDGAPDEVDTSDVVPSSRFLPPRDRGAR